MNTEKKNQHYIPKFYLRNFSYQDNKKQIGLFNTLNNKYIATAKLKTQGSKNFFYGSDGIIEDRLAQLEGQLSIILRKIIDTRELPAKYTNDHFDLLHFVTLTDARNPIKIANTIGMFDEMANRLLEIDPNIDTTKHIPKLDHAEAVKLSIAHSTEQAKIILDLEYKLLLNKTNKPFITSDFPIVKYNQYLELKKWSNSKTGMGATGLQIIVPLNSHLSLILYDAELYRVGNKKQHICLIDDEHEVNQLNLLQFLNCLESLYFNEHATEIYMQKLYKSSLRYKKANITRSEVGLIRGEDISHEEIEHFNGKNLVIVGTTDSEIKMNIKGIKIHSNGKSKPLHPSMAQLRKYASYLMDEKKRKNRF